MKSSTSKEEKGKVKRLPRNAVGAKVTLDKRFKLVQECQNSILDNTDWCAQRGIDIKSYRYWLKQLKELGYDVPTKRTYTDDERYKIVMRGMSSSMSIIDFCKHEGLDTHTFYYWVGRLRRNGYDVPDKRYAVRNEALDEAYMSLMGDDKNAAETYETTGDIDDKVKEDIESYGAAAVSVHDVTHLQNDEDYNDNNDILYDTYTGYKDDMILACSDTKCKESKDETHKDSTTTSHVDRKGEFGGSLQHKKSRTPIRSGVAVGIKCGEITIYIHNHADADIVKNVFEYIEKKTGLQ